MLNKAIKNCKMNRLSQPRIQFMESAEKMHLSNSKNERFQT